ncbi:GTPase Ypt3 [Tribonema minus]|uniref:GTPase Ypt3 n=1 Tax=Tribonema minus TaxID=303371 RepID=A0A835YTJ1_9STRA|nr:GTPase Ypt3 [Tribonema minus]
MGDDPVKVVLLGNSGVGKSNLIARYHANEFSNEFMSTIGVEFVTKKIEVDGVAIRLQIWDTAGQERYASMMKTYYRKAKGALLVYDVTSQSSFDSLEIWRKNLEANADPQCVSMVAGNKCDMEGVVDEAAARAYADAHSMGFMMTSAKTAQNVDTLFEEVARRIIATMAAGSGAAAPRPAAGGGMKLSAPPNGGSSSGSKQSSDCC